MSDTTAADRTDDPYDLNRFVQAQAGSYAQALAELRSGRKRSHWMWYVFPQFEGLGFSSTSRRYSIKSIAEAKAYLRHPVLGPRLTECAEAILAVEESTAHDILGSPDDMKLRSCATLFAHVSPEGSISIGCSATISRVNATARPCGFWVSCPGESDASEKLARRAHLPGG